MKETMALLFNDAFVVSSWTASATEAGMVDLTIVYGSDDRIRALLAEYACPVPFHAVRTRFLGNIASLRLDASPIQALAGLWGGTLPAVDDMDELNGLIQELVGLWSALSQHQSRDRPFRLLRGGIGATAADLVSLCRMRKEEIEGFADGLFGAEEETALPERAHEGVGQLGKIDALLRSVLDLLAREPGQVASESDLATTFRNVRELTRIAEREMHAVVLSCKRARAQAMTALRVKRPTIH